MKKKTKSIIYVSTFVIIFIISALIRIKLLGSAPQKLIRVKWNENMGEIYHDLNYENDNGNQFDLYIPSGLNNSKNQNLILFIHGGSFNSGSKEDGEDWCKYYTAKGYITASVDYTLQNHGKDASIYLMNTEIENAVKAIKQKTEELGYHIAGMAPCGVSAGGTLAMNLAYNGNSVIPVKFVFQLAAPTYFDPSEWSLLMKVDKLDSEEAFCYMMTGKELTDYETEIRRISPACIVNEKSVPSLIGYGLIDHCVPLSQKFYLMDAFNKYQVHYDYIEFPKSNHGMYNDLDKLQQFLDKSLEYGKIYFSE
nr:alpha/beta hydrolase [uncultured Blautia sp.]